MVTVDPAYDCPVPPVIEDTPCSMGSIIINRYDDIAMDSYYLYMVAVSMYYHHTQL